MEKQTENPVDVDMFSEMQMSGDTEVQSKAKVINPKLSFLHKCIHPPSAVPGYCGLPTNDARSEVNLEWRRMNVNKTPYIYDRVTGKIRSTTSADLSTFDYVFLHLNGPRVMSVPFVYNITSNAMEQDFNNLQTIDQYNWSNWRDDANLFRVAYKSTTHCLNATMFNNTGIVTGNQFNPAILFAGPLNRFSETMPSEFRKFVKDMISRKVYTTMPASDHVTRTRYMGLPKYVREELDVYCSLNGAHLNLDPDTDIQVLNLSAINNDISGIDITPTNDSILQMSLRSYGGKAMEGAFSIQRLNTIAPKWQSATNTNPTTNGLYLCYSYNVGLDGSSHFVPFYENAAIGVAGADLKPMYDALWTQDMTMSWVRFSGLSLNQQAGTSSQLLITKQYIGVEIQPTAISSWSAMLKIAPKPDLEAMQALMDAFFEIKDVLPARYNFWGTLASIASQGLKVFGGKLLDNLMSPSDKKEKGTTAKPAKSFKSKEVKEVRSIDNKVDSLEKKVSILLDRMQIQPRPKWNREATQPLEWKKSKPRKTRTQRSNNKKRITRVPPGQKVQNTV